MAFRDMLLRCGACGKEFVYTVNEQRQRQQRGLSTDPPAFCPDCRGADVRLAEAAGPAPEPVEAETPRPSAPRGGSASAGGGRRPSRGERGKSGGGSGGGRRDRRNGGGGGGRKAARPRQTDLRVRHVGAVKYFNKDKGYGFIASEDEGEVFVHLSSLLDEGVHELEVGSPVEFEIEHTARGPQAVDVIQLA